MLEGWLIVKNALFASPDAGTLPVPIQPEQANCVTTDPATGEVTDACIDVPASNQPLVGAGEP